MDLTEETERQSKAEGFLELADRDKLVDDPNRIVQYRAVALAKGLVQGSEAQVRWAWQWLADHPEVTNRMQEWFARHVQELREMGRIK